MSELDNLDVCFKNIGLEGKYRFNYRVAAIIQIGGKLLVHGSDAEKHTFLPGGRVQIGENAEAAIQRELEEELNITAKPTGLAFIIENFFEHNQIRSHEVGLYFNFEGLRLDRLPKDGELIDGYRFQWITANQMEQANLKPIFLIDALQDLANTPKYITNQG